MFVPFFLPSKGGTEMATLNLSKELSRAGGTVVVTTINTMSFGNIASLADKVLFSIGGVMQIKSAGLRAAEILDEVTVIRFPYISMRLPLVRRKEQYSGLLLCPHLFFSVLAENPDIIHVQGIGYFYDVLMIAISSAIKRIPYVITVHSLHEFFHDTFMQTRGLVRYLLQIACMMSFRSASRIVALSRSDIPLLVALGAKKERIVVIPNGAGEEYFRKEVGLEALDAAKKTYGISGQMCLTPAGVKPSKGLDVLLKSIPILRKAGVEMKFIVTGDQQKYAGHFEYLQRLSCDLGVSDTVVFTGQIPDRELIALYAGADIFVLPSLRETLPLAVIEAMAAGKAIVATDVGGVRDLIGDDQNGIILPPSDEKALADAIRTLATNNSLRLEMGSNARRRAEALFRWSAVARKTTEVYDELIKSKARPLGKTRSEVG
jgi:glycosyltransferase involved in cell wall biosynthesis